MADELGRLEELNARLQLVGKGNDVAERQRFCSAFTRSAARLLHGEGWRRIRKTEGQHVDGLDIDKIVNLHTFRIVDVIVDAGLDRAKVAFNDVGEFRDTSRFVEVAPVDVPPPAPAPRPIPPAPGDDEFLEVMRDLSVGRDETNKQLDRIATALESLGLEMASIGEHFGVK